MSAKTRATIEDLYKVEGKAELVNGEIVHMAPTGSRPGRAGGDIYVSLRQQITHLYPTQLPEAPQPQFNPLSTAKLALGEALFFDPNLSRCRMSWSTTRATWRSTSSN